MTNKKIEVRNQDEFIESIAFQIETTFIKP